MNCIEVFNTFSNKSDRKLFGPVPNGVVSIAFSCGAFIKTDLGLD